jgi:hypothetical protein
MLANAFPWPYDGRCGRKQESIGLHGVWELNIIIPRVLSELDENRSSKIYKEVDLSSFVSISSTAQSSISTSTINDAINI